MTDRRFLAWVTAPDAFYGLIYRLEKLPKKEEEKEEEEEGRGRERERQRILYEKRL